VTRVDAHHHVWDLARRPQPWTAPFPTLQRSFGVDELGSEAHDAGVTSTVVVQTGTSPDETLELLGLADGSGLVAGVVGWFDLSDPDLSQSLEQAEAAAGEGRLVGARHQLQVEPDPQWLANPQVRSGLLTLAGQGLAFDLVVSPHQLPLVHRTVAELGEVRFVLDHAGKPPLASGHLDEWCVDVRRLARLPNVAVKLSGLVTEADRSSWTVAQLRQVSEVVLEAFGPDRTMWGSDWPVCLLAASYGEVVSATEELLAGLTAEERSEVWAGSATRWYRLDRR
jgi:L-fuconolactonase